MNSLICDKYFQQRNPQQEIIINSDNQIVVFPQPLVVFVNQVDDNFDHCVLFFGAAFGDHEGEGDEGVVGDALGTVLIIQDTVAVEEPEEQCGGNAFVAVAEGVVLSNEIQEHGGLFPRLTGRGQRHRKSGKSVQWNF